MAEQKERTYMPAGIGGLIRYQEEEEQVIKINPKHLVYGVVAFAAILIAIHLFP